MPIANAQQTMWVRIVIIDTGHDNLFQIALEKGKRLRNLHRCVLRGKLAIKNAGRPKVRKDAAKKAVTSKLMGKFIAHKVITSKYVRQSGGITKIFLNCREGKIPFLPIIHFSDEDLD